MTITKRIVKNPPFIRAGSKPTLSQLLTDKKAAAYLGVSVSYLRKSRSDGAIKGRTPPPPFVRVGGRVYYRLSDLDTWVAKLETRMAV